MPSCQRCSKECKPEVVIKTAKGKFGPRIPQYLDDNENTRVHRINLACAGSAKFTVEHSNPDAIIHLFVYTQDSYWTSQPLNTIFLPYRAGNVWSNTTGNNPSSLEFINDFLPGEYIIRVVLTESPTPVKYTLTTQYTDFQKCSKQNTTNPFLGFWKAESRGVPSVEILQRCDGSLYIKQYNGHESIGFQQTNSSFPQYQYIQDLEKCGLSYRYRLDLSTDRFVYYLISETNQNQLIELFSGNANPVQNTNLVYI